MKYIKFYVLTMLSVALLSAIYFPVLDTTAAPAEKEITLSTAPTDNFIHMEQMAPGDKISQTLDVKNTGNVDFNYFLTAKKDSGDQILFDQLNLVISDGSKTIYKGNLKNVKQLKMGTLKSFKNHNLRFTLEVPLMANNEVKHKSTSVAFKFLANSIESGVSNGSGLPKTGTVIFNLLLLGSFLIIIGYVLHIIQKRRMSLAKQVFK